MAQGHETTAVTMTACSVHDAGFLNAVSMEIGNICCNSYSRLIVQWGRNEAALGPESDKS